jgi:hypothetical protein
MVVWCCWMRRSSSSAELGLCGLPWAVRRWRITRCRSRARKQIAVAAALKARARTQDRLRRAVDHVQLKAQTVPGRIRVPAKFAAVQIVHTPAALDHHPAVADLDPQVLHRHPVFAGGEKDLGTDGQREEEQRQQQPAGRGQVRGMGNLRGHARRLAEQALRRELVVEAVDQWIRAATGRIAPSSRGHQIPLTNSFRKTTQPAQKIRVVNTMASAASTRPWPSPISSLNVGNASQTEIIDANPRATAVRPNTQ